MNKILKYIWDKTLNRKIWSQIKIWINKHFDEIYIFYTTGSWTSIDLKQSEHFGTVSSFNDMSILS